MTETNKQAVRDWFAAIDRRDPQAIRDLTTEDFQFKCMARQPDWLRYRWDRDQFAAAPATMSTLMKAPIRIWIVDMIAEGNRVAVEAAGDGEMLNGRRYNNAYHFVFKLRDGRFCEVLEYSCSHLAQSCFGQVLPGDPEHSHMAA